MQAELEWLEYDHSSMKRRLFTGSVLLSMANPEYLAKLHANYPPHIAAKRIAMRNKLRPAQRVMVIGWVDGYFPEVPHISEPDTGHWKWHRSSMLSWRAVNVSKRPPFPELTKLTVKERLGPLSVDTMSLWWDTADEGVEPYEPIMEYGNTVTQYMQYNPMFSMFFGITPEEAKAHNWQVCFLGVVGSRDSVPERRQGITPQLGRRMLAAIVPDFREWLRRKYTAQVVASHTRKEQ